MAVTTEKSDQVTNQEALPPVRLNTDELGGRLRIARFSFTQGVAAGDANSTVDLVKLPPGKTLTILKNLSRVACSAFGAARLLDIGHTGFTNLDGTVVAAAADVLLDGGDVSAIAELPLGVGTNALTVTNSFTINAKAATLIQAKVLADTIPAGATLTGYIVYVED